MTHPNTRFSIKIPIFHGRVLPEAGSIVGYTALIENLELQIPIPEVISLISEKNKKYTLKDWQVYTPTHQPGESLYKQLVFALKYEGIHLLFFKKLFEKLPTAEIVALLKIQPTGIYSRKIWFLYEWLMREKLAIPDLTIKQAIPLIDEKLQYAIAGISSPRHRIINNLPGSVLFCPIIRKTQKLAQFINANIGKQKSSYLAQMHKDVLQRASAYLLLKDSKASFTIEGEKPRNNRALRWGKAIGEAGKNELSLAELERLQQLVIENPRFLKMGLRTIGGFVGDHDRSTGEPIPDHISANVKDLETLMNGLFEADKILQDPNYDAVLAAATIAFGFVFTHPFVDGNGRLHRYLIHHILAKRESTTQGIIFPISASILDHIDDYRKVLESYSHPLLNYIEWKTTEDNNVEVLNETIDFYRYFDATKQAEFLYDCVEDTFLRIIPQEVTYLQNYDEFKKYLDNTYEMPDKTVALLVRFLEQENGKFSKRALKKEFSVLNEAEISDIEKSLKKYLWKISMAHQTEAQLEKDLIKQLQALGYSSVEIENGEALLANLKNQLALFNKTTFTNKEFDAVLNHLAKGNVFEKAKTLRDYFQLTKEDGTSFYVEFFNSENWNTNLYQVSNQITLEGSYKNRFDVTLLVNGLPLVQIELKRSGIEIKEAFNQINRYQAHSFWSNHGLFQYVQLFVISNGVDTKYLANNRLQSVKQTFFWADANNKNIQELIPFAKAFLNPNHLGKMISHYLVFNETYKILMVMRPYQYFATEAIIQQVKNTDQNAYIWHTTGSGKTLTSFKASQILMALPEVYKVVFVVDRKDLDYQTMNEFNAFKKDSVDVTDNTHALVRQLTDPNTKLVLTTIQKLNNAVSDRFKNSIEKLRHHKIVFIFDECHRSQFGETHKRITQFFDKSQLIGFTGTPIFAENASKNELGKRTTKDLFGNCLHKYVITDAIRDQNVLRFGIEYIGKYKNKSNAFIDIEVEAINTQEVLDSPMRIEKIVDYIIAYHDVKTFNKQYSALLTASSIDNAIQYYDFFQQKKEAGLHNMRIAIIYTYGANEDDDAAQDYLPDEESYSMAAEPASPYLSIHSRDKLETFIGHYNQMYAGSFTTKDPKLFEGYFKDISRRLKDREKENFNEEKDRLDLVIVVNMMLTGFDAKKVNTLYVDKNLKQHGLIQAFSRTNRTMGEQKSQGNIMCFRNLKKSTDDAIALFSNKDAIEVVTMPTYEKIAEKLEEALIGLREITPTYQCVDDLESEEEQALFVQAFRKLLRNLNVLESYTDFNWDDLPIDEQEFMNYKGKYLGLAEKVSQESALQKTSILNDIDFELELIHRDKIGVAYILKLLSQMKGASAAEAKAQRKAIIDLLGGDVKLRSKRELIQKFIDENMPSIKEGDDLEEEFEKYWQEQKVLALEKLCEDEHLDKAQFKALIDAYIYSGREPIKDEIFQCLANRPSILQARVIGERIISKMKGFLDLFEKGMAA